MDFCSKPNECCCRLVQDGGYFFIYVSGRESVINADSQTTDVLADVVGVARYRSLHRGWIVCITAGDDAEHRCSIRGRARYWANTIERVCQWKYTKAADSAPRWLDPGQPAAAAGHAN